MIYLINKFPIGKVEVEKEKAYWVCEINDNAIQQPQNIQPQSQLNKPKGNTFLNMFDSLALRF